jgi:hypothetical protein
VKQFIQSGGSQLQDADEPSPSRIWLVCRYGYMAFASKSFILPLASSTALRVAMPDFMKQISAARPSGFELEAIGTAVAARI